MTDLLTGAGLAPFTLALAILGLLLLVEVLAALAGGSLLSLGGDGGLDADGDPDLGTDAPDSDATGAAEGDGLAALLGLAHAPMLVWLAAFLIGFALSGLLVQWVADGLLGDPLPAALAAIPALAAGLAFARMFAGAFARLLPRHETTALEHRQLARTRGVITQGTASRGRPAEVRVRDRHGNIHYLRAEPLSDGARLPTGTEVAVTRDHASRALRLVPLTEDGDP